MTRWKTGKERFWAKVQKSEDCWLWTGGIIAGTGYGAFHDGQRWSTHRYSWTIHYGHIPTGLAVLHKCDVRACVRPTHLWLGTKQDNSRDMASKNRHFVPGLKGEEHGESKLTNKAVLHIRASRETGVSLARQYGVSPSLISLVRKRKAWGHI